MSTTVFTFCELYRCTDTSSKRCYISTLRTIFYLPVEIILYLNATDIQSISQNSIVYSTKKCTFSVSQALREAGRQGELQGIYLENLQAGFGGFVKGLFELTSLVVENYIKHLLFSVSSHC